MDTLLIVPTHACQHEYLWYLLVDNLHKTALLSIVHTDVDFVLVVLP